MAWLQDKGVQAERRNPNCFPSRVSGMDQCCSHGLPLTIMSTIPIMPDSWFSLYGHAAYAVGKVP